MHIKNDVTERGFPLLTFNDHYGDACTIQKSSLATEHAIWFGVADANPQIMAKNTPEGGVGWVPYSLPKEVLLSTRMHLTQQNVQALLPILQHFADTGELPDVNDAAK